MGYLLLTNDDGVDSPALLPFARALQRLGRVEIVVPDRERSWVGKAITRHHEIDVAVLEREGITLHTVSGYPADCTQLGVHTLFETAPDLVLSGINIGYNHGAAFMMSSGTVGAAVEGWISGIPSLAISAGSVGDWATWSRWIRSDGAGDAWGRLADLATDLVAAIASDFPRAADVVSVNLPWDATAHTERRVTTMARVGYDRLFTPLDDGGYGHRFVGIRWMGDAAGTDIEAAMDGAVSITPIQLPGTAPLDAAMLENLRSRIASGKPSDADDVVRETGQKAEHERR